MRELPTDRWVGRVGRVVEAARLADDGAVLTRSGNGVWLVDAVPPSYPSVISG